MYLVTLVVQIAFPFNSAIWDTGLMSGKTYAGEEIEQLQLANLDDGWKIVSEKELQVLWVARHAS